MRNFGRIVSIILTVLFVIMIPVNVVVRMFDNTISLLAKGNTFWELENADAKANYFEGDYKTEAERLLAGSSLCYRVEAEGAALLLNNGALPLASGSKVSTLSSSSVNLVYGGTGSGNVDASKALDFKEALENSGFEVNETLWNSYLKPQTFFEKLFDKDVKPLYERKASAGESAVLAGQAPIVEAPASHYTAEIKDSIAAYGDAVIITLSRIGGEGYDLEFDDVKAGGELDSDLFDKDGNRKKDDDGNLIEDYNYLELDQNEKDMFAMAKALKDEGKIKSIVVLINTSNAFQVDFLKDNQYGVDACLWVGGLGITGTEAVADILAGKVNPSGSLVDTYCYDNYSSPAMHSYIAQTYAGSTETIEKLFGLVKEEKETVPGNASTYMIYQEGIYVGYKYYETRYEDFVMGNGNAGEFDYSADVAFPFGYGLSYTEYSYSDMSVEYDKTTDQYNITVTVNNDGKVPGKETVQIYAQTPYTDYDKAKGIEKASVQLVGFGKTGVIQAGGSETITISVDRRDLASYDAHGYGTYIFEAGDYYFTAATDSHNAMNNILAAKGYTPENTDGRMDAAGNADLVYWAEREALTTGTDFSYSVSLNGTPITNQLQGADPNSYFGDGSVIFLSRNDWAGTWPTNEAVKASLKLSVTASMVKELTEGRWATMGEDYFNVPEEWKEMPTLNAGNGLSLYDMFNMDDDNDGIKAAKDYDDPAWNKLLENVTIDELISMGDCFHWRHPVASVNAPGSRDENGPQGLTVALFGSGLDAEATAFTSEDVMAATFNTDLMYEIGVMIGNDCIDAGVSCLYGPGANTHRTPYGGRNFEYYSEDGFLAGEMGGAEVSGILSKGVDVVMKHFALNDTEQDRLGQAAWLTEQAAREIYLKAFQKALEENDGRGGVMTSYTRWGTTWSGMNQGLMTGILREEWGNNSMHITDNILVSYCNGADAVIAGGVTCFDAMLPYAVNSLKDAKDDPVVVNAMVEAMHHNLYTIINSAAMNGVGENTVVKAVTPSIITTITIATAVLGVLGIGGCIIFRKEY